MVLLPAYLHAKVIEQLIAVVDGEPYTLSNVGAYAKSKMGREFPSGDLNQINVADREVLEQFITEKLLDAEIREAGIKVSDQEVEQYIEQIKAKNRLTDEALKTALSREGQTLASYRASVKSELEKTEIINRQVKGKVIQNARLAMRKPLPDGQGPVRAVRSGPQAGGALRIVLDLDAAQPVKSFLVGPDADAGHRLVVELPPVANAIAAVPAAAGPAATAGTPPAPTAPQVLAASSAALSREAAAVTDPVKSLAATAQGRDLVIAVDAGHGGQDPGALGRGGTREKDVTLAIARRLAAAINAEEGMRAVLIDRAGNDRYVLGNDRLVLPSSQLPERNASLGQGAGWGIRADRTDVRHIDAAEIAAGRVGFGEGHQHAPARAAAGDRQRIRVAAGQTS